MRFGGFQPFSLSDFPEHIAAIAFAQGCNFRCPFCHNGDLLALSPSEKRLYPEKEILNILSKRQGKLEGLVVTGGEPTLQADLPRFLKLVKSIGYKIKLDTNGSQPVMLARLIADHLLDYIAMDIKAPLTKYNKLIGTTISTDIIEESIKIITKAELPHHFRTTVVTPLLTPADIHAIKNLVPAGSKHVTQTFNPENALDPALRSNTAIA